MELLTRKLLACYGKSSIFMTLTKSHWKPARSMLVRSNGVGNSIEWSLFEKSLVVDHAWKRFGGDCLLEVFCCIVFLKMVLNGAVFT